MQVETKIPELDELLADYRPLLGEAYRGYSNHCRRVFNYCLVWLPAEREKIALAAAFHDLGIWSEVSFDYLAASRRLAREHLLAGGHSDWLAEVEAMIENHHKLTPYRNQPSGLVEAFRRADWIDVSLGTLTMGLPRAFVAEVRAAIPNAGFHAELLRWFGHRLRRHPWSPLPMMRW
jgi:hypothetical protein